MASTCGGTFYTLTSGTGGVRRPDIHLQWPCLDLVEHDHPGGDYPGIHQGPSRLTAVHYVTVDTATSNFRTSFLITEGGNIFSITYDDGASHYP